MAAPKRLTAEARRMWDQAERELVKRGTWRPALAPILEAMVLNRCQARAALAAASAEPVVTGSTGQDVAHPMFAVAARCEQVALQHARALGLHVDPRAGADAPAEPVTRDPLDELAQRRRARG